MKVEGSTTNCNAGHAMMDVQSEHVGLKGSNDECPNMKSGDVNVETQPFGTEAQYSDQIIEVDEVKENHSSDYGSSTESNLVIECDELEFESTTPSSPTKRIRSPSSGCKSDQPPSVPSESLQGVGQSNLSTANDGHSRPSLTPVSGNCLKSILLNNHDYTKSTISNKTIMSDAPIRLLKNLSSGVGIHAQPINSRFNVADSRSTTSPGYPKNIQIRRHMNIVPIDSQPVSNYYL